MTESPVWDRVVRFYPYYLVAACTYFLFGVTTSALAGNWLRLTWKLALLVWVLHWAAEFYRNERRHP